MAYFFNSENGSMLPNSVGAGVTLAHFLFGVSLLIVKSRSVLSFQHMFGFPLWYYLLTTSYALFSGCAWSLWSLSVDQLSEANIAAVDDTQSYIAVGSFRYVILDAVNVLLMIVSTTTSLHFLVMNMLLVQLSRMRKRRREVRVRGKSEPGNKTVLFAHEYTSGQKCFLYTVGMLVDVVNKIITIIHSLVFLDLSLLWFPMPFYKFWCYQTLVQSKLPLQVRGERTQLEAHFGDFYFLWLRTKLTNLVTFGIFEKCCAKHTFEEWLDKKMVWKREPPAGFNDDFKYFSAKLSYPEVVTLFLMMVLSSLTIFITWPFVYFWAEKKWMQKVRLGGRTVEFDERLKPVRFFCLAWQGLFSGKAKRAMDEALQFNMNVKLWYWDKGLHSLEQQVKFLKTLLETNDIEIAIPSTVHINPKRQSIAPLDDKYDLMAMLDKVGGKGEGGEGKESLPSEQSVGKAKDEANADKVTIEMSTVGDKATSSEPKDSSEVVGKKTEESVKAVAKTEESGNAVGKMDGPTSTPAPRRNSKGERNSIVITPKRSFWEGEKVISVEELVDILWPKYDVDLTGSLDATEVRKLVTDFTGLPASVDRCEKFLKSIDQGGDGLAQKDELVKFIKAGINLPSKERNAYQRRGAFHATVIKFFDGIERQRVEMSALKQGNITSVKSLLDKIWVVYVGGDNSLGPYDTKRMLQDFTGTLVSEKMCKDFLRSIDSDGDARIQKEELDEFIRNGIELDEEECRLYARRGKLHRVIINFFNGVKEKLKPRPSSPMPDFSEIENFLRSR